MPDNASKCKVLSSHQGIAKFDIGTPKRETSDAHIVELLERFWNVKRLPPSTNAQAIFEPLELTVAP